MYSRILILIFFINFNCSSQNSNKQNDHLIVNDFENTVYTILDLYNAKNEKELNRYIHSDLNIYYLFRRGAHDNLMVADKIDFKNPIPEYLPYDEFNYQNKLAIQYDKSPNYSCDDLSWNINNGIFVDTITVDKKRSEIAIDENKYELNIWSQSELDKLNKIEESSKKVICINDKGNEIILYLSLYKGKWYLTGIDRFESCTA